MAGIAGDVGETHVPWPGANADNRRPSPPVAPRAPGVGPGRSQAMRRSAQGGEVHAIPQSSIAATALPWTLRTDAHKQDGGHGAQRATLMGSMGGDGEDLPRQPRSIIKTNVNQNAGAVGQRGRSASGTKAKASGARKQVGGAHVLSHAQLSSPANRTEATVKKQVTFHPQESEVSMRMLARRHKHY